VEVRSRKSPQKVLLRLRHPQVAPIKSVTINAQDSQAFDAVCELVRPSNFAGKVALAVLLNVRCSMLVQQHLPPRSMVHSRRTTSSQELTP